jgi:hypothetical protein
VDDEAPRPSRHLVFGIPATSFVGRETELTVVERRVSAVAAGEGGAVIVRGEAGIGKTALIDAALGRIPPRVQLRRGTAEAMDAHRPFGVFIDALRLDAGQLAPAQFGVAEAISDIVQRECAATPIALVLEDLHWADGPTLAMVQRLGRVLSQLPLLLVCSARFAPERGDLEEVLGALELRGAARLELEPLSDNTTAMMVAGLLGTEPPAELMAHVRAAGGNPFFVTQLVTAVRDEGGPKHSPTLYATILRHLASLSKGTRETLGLASVLGSAFSIADLAVVTERSVVALQPALQEAAAAGVLGDAGDRLAFRHELIRDALYEELSAALRLELHSQMARELARVGVAPTRVAEHLLRTQGPADRELVALMHETALELSAVAPGTAVAVWERALDAAGPFNRDREQLVAGLAITLLDGGRPADAEANCRRALALGVPAGQEGPVLTCLVRSLVLQGRIGEADAESKLAATSPRLSSSEHAAHLARAAIFPLFAGDLPAAADTARRAEEVARVSGNVAARTQALVTAGHVANCGSDLAEAERLLSAAVKLAEAVGDVADPDALPHAHFGFLLSDMDRVDEANAMIAAGRDAAERVGSAAGLYFAQQAGAGLAILAGRFDDLLAELDANRALAEDSGFGWQYSVAALRGLVVLSREGPHASAPFAGPLTGEVPFFAYGMAWPHLFQLRQLAATDRAAEAVPLGWEAWAACESHGFDRECALLGPDLVWLLCEQGDDAQARRIADHHDALAARNPSVASLSASACRVRAVVDGDGDGLAVAVERYRDSPRRFEHARCAEEAARLLLRSGRSEEAATYARDAVSTYALVGAGWVASSAQSSFRDLGLRLGASGAR